APARQSATAFRGTSRRGSRERSRLDRKRIVVARVQGRVHVAYPLQALAVRHRRSTRRAGARQGAARARTAAVAASRRPRGIRGRNALPHFPVAPARRRTTRRRRRRRTDGGALARRGRGRGGTRLRAGGATIAAARGGGVERPRARRASPRASRL